jgi:hypothetical protein
MSLPQQSALVRRKQSRNHGDGDSGDVELHAMETRGRPRIELPASGAPRGGTATGGGSSSAHPGGGPSDGVGGGLGDADGGSVGEGSELLVASGTAGAGPLATRPRRAPRTTNQQGRRCVCTFGWCQEPVSEEMTCHRLAVADDDGR